MLFLLYGSFGEIHKQSVSFFYANGIPLVSKLNYSATEKEYTSPAGTRSLVSKKYFDNHTDSLFRYEINGYQVGFRQEQILDAVSHKNNRLLTMSTTDIALLASIKRIYGDSVCLIFCCVDDDIIRETYRHYDLPKKKQKQRIRAGRRIKECYAEHSELFDEVVLYSGEDSAFHFANLMKQYQKILLSHRADKAPPSPKPCDVLIASASRDWKIAEQLCQTLKRKGIEPFFHRQSLNPADNSEKNSENALRTSKIVIAVVSSHLTQSPRTLEFIRLAEGMGAVILPYFAESVDTGTLFGHGLSSLAIRLEQSSDRRYNSLPELADTLHLFLHGQQQLRSLSFQSETYSHLKCPSLAKEQQRQHLTLSRRLYDISYGSIISGDAVVYSFIKLIHIETELEEWKEALALTREAFRYLDNEKGGKTERLLGEYLVLCCRRLDIPREVFQTYVSLLSSEGTLLEMFDGFPSSISRLFNEPSVPSPAIESSGIVERAEDVVDLFYSLMESSLSSKNAHDLITAYDRILQLSRHMNTSGSTAVHCVKRIANLQQASISDRIDTNIQISEALKIYLGKALPRSGAYDVFISFKREDSNLARKVYDFLTDSGMEVFFSDQTLPLLKNSDYQASIYHALDNSKHMVLVGSDPEYFKTNWVSEEWNYFRSEILENRKTGTLIIVLPEQYTQQKSKLPSQLRKTEIIPTSQFRQKLLPYLW